MSSNPSNPFETTREGPHHQNLIVNSEDRPSQELGELKILTNGAQREVPLFKVPVNFSLNFHGPSGNPLPQFPSSMNGIVRYNVLEGHADAGRDHMVRRNRLEEDVFGLFRYRTDNRPSCQPPKNTDDNNRYAQQASSLMATERIQRLIRPQRTVRVQIPGTRQKSATAFNGQSPSSYGHTYPAAGPNNDHETADTELDRHKFESNNSGPIISDKNPEFKDFAQALSEYQSSTNSPPADTQNEKGHFRPSRMVQERHGMHGGFPQEENLRYQGDTASKSFAAQISELPDDINCALWVTNLPAITDEAEVFGVIRTGAVYAIHVNHSDYFHDRSAAKIVFMKHTAAASFLEQATFGAGIRVQGNRIRVSWNRHGYQDNEQPERTRVLHIKGPTHLMDIDMWKKYFATCVEFQLEAASQAPSTVQGKVIMEFRFARVDGQSESLYRAIQKEPKYRGVYEVMFGPDPCDPDSGFN